MTTLTQDEIIAWAREAGLQVVYGQLEAVERFATLCRADLEADLEKHRALLLQHLAVIDPLRAENERLWAEREDPLKQAEFARAECNKFEAERDALRAEVERLKAACDHQWFAFGDSDVITCTKCGLSKMED